MTVSEPHTSASNIHTYGSIHTAFGHPTRQHFLQLWETQKHEALTFFMHIYIAALDLLLCLLILFIFCFTLTWIIWWYALIVLCDAHLANPYQTAMWGTNKLTFTELSDDSAPEDPDDFVTKWTAHGSCHRTPGRCAWVFLYVQYTPDKTSHRQYIGTVDLLWLPVSKATPKGTQKDS